MPDAFHPLHGLGEGAAPANARITHAQQHYVPVFLLKHWHSGEDDRLTQYQWLMNRLHASRCKAKYVAKEEHLYSRMRETEHPDTALEKSVLGPMLDEPAALVHARLLRTGVAGLSDEEKATWARFIVSLMLRTPAMVDHIRKRGRAMLVESFADNNVGGDEDGHPNLLGWVEAVCPWELDDLGVRTLPLLVSSEVLNEAVLKATWATRELSRFSPNLLLGDRPLIRIGALKDEFLLVLPISPTRAFMAFNTDQMWEKIIRIGHSEFAKRLNSDTGERADRYVFATGSQHEPLIKKYLPPRSVPGR